VNGTLDGWEVDRIRAAEATLDLHFEDLHTHRGELGVFDPGIEHESKTRTVYTVIK
jgi:hypothetical protein